MVIIYLYMNLAMGGKLKEENATNIVKRDPEAAQACGTFNKCSAHPC